MENKKKTLRVLNEAHNWGCSQTVYNGDNEIFSAEELWDEPQEVCFGRSLFDAYQYIDALKYGMKLAQDGYTEIEFVEEGTSDGHLKP